ncbi:MAG: SulP family inorganic anion transporter [Alphaproteobacteria bacterium]|nr:SulP family inorganic anion transporter [Alphaproteobacteria bacterium]
MRLDFSNLRGDIFGGLTTTVVALPLAMAFGVASGVGPIPGLYGAIVVGFFAALFGGTPAQVSGPTGPMTAVMAVVVAEHAHDLSQAFAIVFLGGLFQVAFGFLKIGRFVSYTPFSVVSGFMSGIGVIIILIQTLPFFGIPIASGGPVGAIAEWSRIPENLNSDAVVIASISLAVMVFWPEKLRALAPPPLATLVIGTLLGVFLFDAAPIIANVPTGFPEFQAPFIPMADLPSVVQPALILALMGSIDSLLTSLVADSITHTRHNSDRELIGQGIGNMAAGLIGGLPGAGATMRTVVNVRAGGRTRLSGALHALILLALVLGLGPLAEHIPHAVLAGILLKVGWDIIDWDYLKRLPRTPRDKVVVMFVTLGLTVFVDLITAVAVGLIFASFVTAKWMETEELKGVTAVAIPEEDDDLSTAERNALRRYNGQILVIFLRGRFSYASARELIQRTNAASFGHKTIIYDMTEAAHVDTSAALAIEGFLNAAVENGVDCYVAGLSGTAAETLRALGALDEIPAGHLTATLLDAIAAAGEHLTPSDAPTARQKEQ